MKQDRIHPRTAVDLQRKYGRKVTESGDMAAEAIQQAEQAAQTAENAARIATGMQAELGLTLMVTENGEVVSEINGVANVIKFLANCIRIESDNFTLAEDGTVSINGGSIVLQMSGGDYVRIGKDYDVIEIEQKEFAEGSGFRLGMTPGGLQFSAAGAQSTATPIMFGHNGTNYAFNLMGDWSVNGVRFADLIQRIEALEG